MTPLAQRFALLLLPLAACASGPATPDAPLAPEVPLTGSYTSEHQVGIFDGDDFVPTEVTDTLVLRERGDSLAVTFSLIGANAHTCGFGGLLGREGDRWVARETLDYLPNAPTCALSVGIARDSIVLRDSAYICRRAYCGARASIDEAVFARSTWSPDTSAYETF